MRMVPFGAFVALEPTIDGLIHLSQVATKRIAKVEDELKIGDVVRCKVLDVNPEAKRISLSRKEVLLEEQPPIEDIIEEVVENQDGSAPAPAPEKREHTRRDRDEDKIELPPVESATTSLADLFANVRIETTDAE